MTRIIAFHAASNVFSPICYYIPIVALCFFYGREPQVGFMRLFFRCRKRRFQVNTVFLKYVKPQAV